MKHRPKKRETTAPGEALAKLLVAEDKGASPQTRGRLARAFERTTQDYFKQRGVRVRIHITDCTKPPP